MFGIFKKLSESNNYKNEQSYKKVITKLTNLIREVEKKNNNIWFQKVINNIKVTIWVETNLTTINIKIVENTNYEFSLDFDKNIYKFVKTNVKNSIPDSVYMDNFNSDIKTIFLDIVNRTIQYFSDKLIIEESTEIKKVKQNILTKTIEKKSICNKEEIFSLSQAIERKNTDKIQYYINNGSSQNIMFHNMTLLYYVILKMNTDTALIEFLLQKHASITKKNDDIDDISKKELNKVLIKYYELDEIIERYNKSALDLVIEKNDFVLLKLFLQYNPQNKRLQNWFIDNQIKDKKLLNLLIEKNDFVLLKLFLQYKPQNKTLQNWFINNKIKDEKLLNLLIEHNKSNYILLKKLSKLNPDNLNILNQIEKLDYLKVNQFINGITPLYEAIENVNIEEIEKLLKYGADTNKKNSNNYQDYKNYDLYNQYSDETIFNLAIKKNNIEVIKLLIKDTKYINILLCLSIEKSKKEITSYLIESSDDLDKISNLADNRTPLSISISMNDYESAELLIKKGANPNKMSDSTYRQNIPLRSVCDKQNLKILKLLLDNGANPNITGSDGRTALFNAIEATKANKEIIRYLIKNGADINKEDNSGISPLSFAESSKVSLVKVLTESIEMKLDETSDNISSQSNKKINDKILSQNKAINKLKEEIKLIKEDDKSEQIEEFQNTIKIQIVEIKELQNKLLQKEDETKNLIYSFNNKLTKLEKKFSTKKIVKPKIPLNITVETTSLKQDDGVIVKRESFDDF